MFAIRDGEWKLIDGLGSGGFTDPMRIEHNNTLPAG
jgi:arylsulfatase A